MGAGMLSTGFGLLLMHGVEPSSGWTTLLVGFIFTGIGVGMVNPGIASTAISVVEPARAGMASGINSTFRQVGIATGVATLGAIFQSKIASSLAGSVPQAPSSFSDAVSSGATEQALQNVPASFHDQAATAANQAFINGFNEILLIAGAVAIVGGIASLVLIRQRDIVASPQQETASEGDPAPTAA